METNKPKWNKVTEFRNKLALPVGASLVFFGLQDSELHPNMYPNSSTAFNRKENIAYIGHSTYLCISFTCFFVTSGTSWDGIMCKIWEGRGCYFAYEAISSYRTIYVGMGYSFKGILTKHLSRLHPKFEKIEVNGLQKYFRHHLKIEVKKSKRKRKRIE